MGTARSGQLQLQTYGLIETTKTQSIWQRYQQLDQELGEILDQYHPKEAALESVFFSKNQKTALRVSEARGVIINCLLRYQLRCFEYTPPQVKQAVTGYGNADKTAVEKMVRLQMKTMMQESSNKIIDDTIDAMAVAMTHAASRQTLIQM